MALDVQSRARFNLEKASVLLLDDTPMGMSVLVQIITGFGVKQLYRCSSFEAAQEVAMSRTLDLAIVDALAPSGRGYDFVEWLRTGLQEPNCYIPALITTGHTPTSHIARARDCGGHFIIKKPIAPITMLERIIWVARARRPFLFAGSYVGPDRRFRDEGAPDGVPRRREDMVRAAQEAEVQEEPPADGGAQEGATAP